MQLKFRLLGKSPQAHEILDPKEANNPLIVVN